MISAGKTCRRYSRGRSNYNNNCTECPQLVPFTGGTAAVKPTHLAVQHLHDITNSQICSRNVLELVPTQRAGGNAVGVSVGLVAAVVLHRLPRAGHAQHEYQRRSSGDGRYGSHARDELRAQQNTRRASQRVQARSSTQHVRLPQNPMEMDGIKHNSTECGRAGVETPRTWMHKSNVK